MRIFLLTFIFLLIIGCAERVNLTQVMTQDLAGFWSGLLHGFILPFALIGSWFSEDISIYAIYNDGSWYDTGFVFGVACAASLRQVSKEVNWKRVKKQ